MRFRDGATPAWRTGMQSSFDLPFAFTGTTQDIIFMSDIHFDGGTTNRDRFRAVIADIQTTLGLTPQPPLSWVI